MILVLKRRKRVVVEKGGVVERERDSESDGENEEDDEIASVGERGKGAGRERAKETNSKKRLYSSANILKYEEYY